MTDIENTILTINNPPVFIFEYRCLCCFMDTFLERDSRESQEVNNLIFKLINYKATGKRIGLMSAKVKKTLDESYAHVPGRVEIITEALNIESVPDEETMNHREATIRLASLKALERPVYLVTMDEAIRNEIREEAAIKIIRPDEVLGILTNYGPPLI